MLALICLLAYETAVVLAGATTEETFSSSIIMYYYQHPPGKFIPTSLDLLKTNKWLNGCTFDLPAVTCAFAVR